MTKKHSKNSIKKNDRIHQYIFKKPRKLYYKYIELKSLLISKGLYNNKCTVTT